jgi:uncharacterized protein GlcG (DUF336 family)
VRLDLELAERMTRAACEAAAADDCLVSAAVVDGGGHLVAFRRMDRAEFAGATVAVDKAFTAAAARNRTAFYGEVSLPGGAAWGIDKTNGGHFCVIGGGVPVEVEGTVVGAIGISSGSAAQDVDVAEWAVEQFHARGVVAASASDR